MPFPSKRIIVLLSSNGHTSSLPSAAVSELLESTPGLCTDIFGSPRQSSPPRCLPCLPRPFCRQLLPPTCSHPSLPFPVNSGEHWGYARGSSGCGWGCQVAMSLNASLHCLSTVLRTGLSTVLCRVLYTCPTSTGTVYGSVPALLLKGGSGTPSDTVTGVPGGLFLGGRTG